MATGSLSGNDVIDRSAMNDKEKGIMNRTLKDSLDKLKDEGFSII